MSPFPQNFDLFRWRAMIEPKLAFLQEQEEMFAGNTFIVSQHALGLVPKVLNAVDVVFLIGEEL